MSAGILVGFDGSPDALAALEWAMREASARHLAVRVLFVEPDIASWDAAAATMSWAPVVVTSAATDVTAVLEQARKRAADVGVEITTASVIGSPAAVLVEQSRRAELVVIGSRGLGSAASVILGSSVVHVSSHARCPVVVAQARGSADGPVVVGVDGTADSEALVAWALDHASRHFLPLEVVHVYSLPVYPGVVPTVPPEEVSRATADAETRLTREVLAGWAERYPDVVITMRVLHGRPAAALVEATRRASVTVVGSRGRGAFLGMLLGSTSQGLLHHAEGTVVVVPRQSHQ